MEERTKYLIIYDSNSEMYETEADSFQDCIVNFAKYTGNASNLLIMALNRCSSGKDYVGMFNHFCAPGEEICKIYVIEKTIFEGSQRDKECVSQKSPDLAALCKAAFDCN